MQAKVTLRSNQPHFNLQVIGVAMLTRSTRDSLFRACAIGAWLPTLFHTVSIFSPTVASLEYPPSYPVWRHLVLIAIGVSSVWLFQRRPWWLVWAYGVLTVQTVNGHGRAIWRFWQERGAIDWISIAACLAIPLVLLLLVIDRLERRREDATETRLEREPLA
jgi:hypothetical protein